MTQAQNKLSTGFDRLDGALQGGITEGSMVEILAFPCSSSEVWCYHLAVQASMQGKRTLWVDSSSFSPYWIRCIARRYGSDPDEVIGSISVMKIYLMSQLMDNFDKVVKECSDEYGLVIVNPMTPLLLYESPSIKIPKCERAYDFRYDAEPLIDDGQEDLSPFIKEMRQLTKDTGVIAIVVRWAYPVLSRTDRGQSWDLSFKMAYSGKRQRHIELVSGLDTLNMDVFHGYGGFYETSTQRDIDDLEMRVVL